MSERLTTHQRIALYLQNNGSLRGGEPFTLHELLDEFDDLLPQKLISNLEVLALRGWIAWDDDMHRTVRLCQPIVMRYEDMVREKLAAMYASGYSRVEGLKP